ncbi:pyridoxine/pyridoxamine 5'-phosphate oxidase-like [Watersipora subatra]|uniref:pyridoxine/pyridoxamine 5'-phosphate oxidase-like n=1 Tax=Watersipora subatra TaxID=2589382 RepID=UPI00355B92F4
MYRRALGRLLSSHTVMADISALRVNYETKDTLNIENLPTTDPLQLFSQWFEDARSCNSILEPNAMTIATADKNGYPSARMVLLKGFDSTGFQFYTNYSSYKGSQLAENPRAALLFYWEPLHRQVRIEGTVERLSATTSDEYFASRPHASQLGTASSQQSTPIRCREVLMEKYSELEQLYPSGQKSVPRPVNWGGFLIVPHAIEFWQGQSNRLHQRIQFKKDVQDEVDKSFVKTGSTGWFYYLLSS